MSFTFRDHVDGKLEAAKLLRKARLEVHRAALADPQLNYTKAMELIATHTTLVHAIRHLGFDESM